VDDVEAAVEELKAKGVAFPSSIREMPRYGKF
jgi:hypothetical protein